LCASNAAAFTELFCSPDDCKSTFDYYAFVGATAKTHLASVFTRRGKRDREWLLWLQWREKLDAAYTAELRVPPPFIERCDHFVENYYSWYQRRAGKVSRQTRMIGVDQTENVKLHAQGYCGSIISDD
jgi:hypothetical protein